MMFSLSDLPSPSPDQRGFPWTEASPPPPRRSDWQKITVVTPSYNQGAYLEATLRSVLLQNYPNLEYIVIDGGSNDESLAILQKYAPFLSYWVSEPDKGQTDAINKGFRQSTGAIMGWLNSDDMLLPGALQTLGIAFNDKPSAKVITAFRKVALEDDSLINFIRPLPTDFFVTHRNVIAQEATYWQREVWEAIGELDESLRFGMDYEYWHRMIANGYQFSLLPAYIGYFRHHDESKTSTLQDTYRAELSKIFQRYNIAQDEADALRKMGKRSDTLYTLTKELSHQPITDNPGMAYSLLKLIHHPLFSPPILTAYRLYQKWRTWSKS